MQELDKKDSGIFRCLVSMSEQNLIWIVDLVDLNYGSAVMDGLI